MIRFLAGHADLGEDCAGGCHPRPQGTVLPWVRDVEAGSHHGDRRGGAGSGGQRARVGGGVAPEGQSGHHHDLGGRQSSAQFTGDLCAVRCRRTGSHDGDDGSGLEYGRIPRGAQDRRCPGIPVQGRRVAGPPGKQDRHTRLGIPAGLVVGVHPDRRRSEPTGGVGRMRAGTHGGPGHRRAHAVEQAGQPDRCHPPQAE